MRHNALELCPWHPVHLFPFSLGKSYVLWEISSRKKYKRLTTRIVIKYREQCKSVKPPTNKIIMVGHPLATAALQHHLFCAHVFPPTMVSACCSPLVTSTTRQAYTAQCTPDTARGPSTGVSALSVGHDIPKPSLSAAGCWIYRYLAGKWTW